MVLISPAAATISPVEVSVTNGRGMNPEEITDLAMRRIMHVADTAPMPLREQAIAFREQVRGVLTHYLAQAQRSERTTMVAMLERAGHTDAAELIRKS